MASQQQYVPLGQSNAPAGWVLPDTLDLVLETVFAHFDGSGAGGSYLPTLQILSDSGHTIAEIPMDASVAAGASVEATWAPFLRGAAAAGAALTPQYGIYDTAFQTIAPGVQSTQVWSYSGGAALLDLTDPTGPLIKAQGVYYLSALMSSNVTPWNPSKLSVCEIIAQVAPLAIDGIGVMETDSAGKFQGVLANVVAPCPAGTVLQIVVSQFDTVNRPLGCGPVDVVKLFDY